MSNVFEEWDAAEAAREEQLDELIRQDETDELLGLGTDRLSEFFPSKAGIDR